MKQELKYNEDNDTFTLNTLREDDSILSEPITREEAYKWQAENKY